MEYYFVIAQPFIVAFVASLSSGGVTGVSVAGVLVFVLLVGGFILARRSNRQPERRFHGFLVIVIVLSILLSASFLPLDTPMLIQLEASGENPQGHFGSFIAPIPQFTYLLTIHFEDQVKERTCFFISKVPLRHSSDGELVQVCSYCRDCIVVHSLLTMLLTFSLSVKASAMGTWCHAPQ